MTDKKQSFTRKGGQEASELAKKILIWLNSEEGKKTLDKELGKVEDSLVYKQDRDPSVSSETLNRRFNF